MNYLKYVLCKWFSNDDSHREVTVGSFTKRFIIYVAIIYTITYAPFHELSTTTNEEFIKMSFIQITLTAFQDLSILIGYTIYILIACIAIIKTIGYIKDIQICKCEK